MSACGLCVLLIVLGGSSPPHDQAAPAPNPSRRASFAYEDRAARTVHDFSAASLVETVSDADTQWNPASDDEDCLRRNPRRHRRMHLPPPPVLNDRDDSQTELHGGSSLHPVGLFVPPTADGSALSRIVGLTSAVPSRRDRLALFRRYRL